MKVGCFCIGFLGESLEPRVIYKGAAIWGGYLWTLAFYTHWFVPRKVLDMAVKPTLIFQTRLPAS